MVSEKSSDPGKLKFSVSICLSSFGDSGLPCDLSALKDLRRVVGFQFVQFCSYCVDGTEDFQVLYMSSQKLEVPPIYVHDVPFFPSFS